ncbi:MULTISPECIES: conjugal transfer protein [Bacillus]|uniref:conjugal transfer protein n=1 Tax=Bacillus TaxID=1386 RepID=UPI001573E691|nr:MULTISPECIES: conjugal transfer protein [Bacillus]MBC6975118.1 conjugal transfer protein [Bacillus sp. Xin]MBY0600372.1 conjugal transfer protein [Bacillus bingmayongensis]NSW38447.1 conjugal transfer protein [Bacillus sp. Xin1]
MWQKSKQWFQKTFENRQGKARKSIQIPSYRGRLIGKWAFWILFSWMLIVSVTTVIKGKTDTKANASTIPKQVTQKQNLATRPEAIEFARGFVKEYFTWQRGEEGQKKRAERLKPYIVQTLDSQVGLDTGSLQWDSTFLYATILKVDETKEKEANIIFKVRYKLHWMKPDNSGEEVKEVVQQVSVPVQSDEKAFVVNGFPHIVKVAEKAKIKEEESEREEIKDVSTKEEVREFLPTFFKSYTTSTQKELAYVLDNPRIKGLEGAMKFEKVNSSKVYPGKTKGTYEVHAEVLLIDAHSETKMRAVYTLFVKKDGKQFVVTDLQN